jgi:hypothetical protein
MKKDERRGNGAGRRYLLPVDWRRGSWTEEEEMLYTAFSHVPERIYKTLFDVRAGIEEIQPGIGLELLDGGRVDTNGKKCRRKFSEDEKL